jgi:hypothetical protein
MPLTTPRRWVEPVMRMQAGIRAQHGKTRCGARTRKGSPAPAGEVGETMRLRDCERREPKQQSSRADANPNENENALPLLIIYSTVTFVCLVCNVPTFASRLGCSTNYQSQVHKFSPTTPPPPKKTSRHIYWIGADQTSQLNAVQYTGPRALLLTVLCE